jgi:type IV secretion system protein VirB9
MSERTAWRGIRTERTSPTLTCVPLFVCDLVLEPGETIVNVAVGDSVRWIIAPASSGSAHGDTAHVLIKPTQDALRTNLIITTNRRSYDVMLVSRKNDPVLRIGFIYPQSVRHEVRNVRAVVPTPSATPIVFDFNYRVNGDRALAPVRTYNDGAHTFLEMQPTLQGVPILFAVDAGGADELVNYRFADHRFVIDAVPARLELLDGIGRGQRRATVVHGGNAR